MNPISTILFDLCDAIIPGSFSGIAGVLAVRVGQPVEEILPAFAIPESTDLLLGKITEDTYFDLVIRRSGWNISPNDIQEHLRQMFSLERPDMRLIIEDLSKQYRMVLISDISKESAESILEAHPFLSQLFPQQIFSFEQGLLKRDSKGFSTMLEKYDINPTESLLIDDSEGNISLARSLGARAIHFQSPSQLLRALGETDIRNSLPLRLEEV